jgi:hypothetical protein
MSISVTCSISSRSMGRPVRFSCTWSPSTMRASSCRRRARQPGSSRSSWSSPGAMRKAPRRRRRIPARSPVPMRSTKRRFAAPGCCECSTSTNCLPPPRRSGGCDHFWASGWLSSRMVGGSESWPWTASLILAALLPAFRPGPCRSSIQHCRRSGRARILSTSPATPIPPAMSPRSKVSSKIPRTMPSWS